LQKALQAQGRLAAALIAHGERVQGALVSPAGELPPVAVAEVDEEGLVLQDPEGRASFPLPWGRLSLRAHVRLAGMLRAQLDEEERAALALGAELLEGGGAEPRFPEAWAVYGSKPLP